MFRDAGVNIKYLSCGDKFHFSGTVRAGRLVARATITSTRGEIRARLSVSPMAKPGTTTTTDPLIAGDCDAALVAAARGW